MKNFLLLLIIVILQSGCTIKYKTADWTEVKFEKAGYSVECLKRLDKDLTSTEYREEDKSGFLHCMADGVAFFIHSAEWNVAEDQKENSDRYFKTIPGNGVGEGKEIILNHEGKKAIRNVREGKVEQHFIIDKTAFHMQVRFNEKKVKPDARELEIAERFFNSFKLLKK